MCFLHKEELDTTRHSVLSTAKLPPAAAAVKQFSSNRVVLNLGGGA